LGVDPNHFAVHVHKWSTTVSAIDRGIGLQEALKVCEERSLAFFLRNDAGRDCLVETKGRPNRQHPIADLSGIGVAKRDSREILRRVDLYDRHVSFLIDTDNPTAIFFARLQA